MKEKAHLTELEPITDAYGSTVRIRVSGKCGFLSEKGECHTGMINVHRELAGLSLEFVRRSNDEGAEPSTSSLTCTGKKLGFICDSQITRDL